jgi:hypothetical protein
LDELNATSTIGAQSWAIAEGFIPPRSSGPEDMESHETACILNAGKRHAHVEITVFFSDRDPAGPYRLTIPGQRTLHVRLNELSDPEPIPPGKDYACVLISDEPIVVQHTRLDSRQAANALLSTVAYAGKADYSV